MHGIIVYCNDTTFVGSQKSPSFVKDTGVYSWYRTCIHFLHGAWIPHYFI